MVWCGLTVNGPTKPYFIEKNTKINTDYYKNRILPHAKREGLKLFGSNKWVYQQDGAPCHTSAKSMQWCFNNFHRVTDNHKWSANSPDLNPLDYYFWSAIERQMEGKKYKDYDELKKGIVDAIEKVPKAQITHACTSFMSRLRKVEQAKGEYVLS